MLTTLLLAAAAACSLHGRVVVDGAPLPGAQVALIHTSFKTTTDSQGLYAFRDVPPGAYDIEFTLAGLITERRAVVLRPGETALQDQPLTLEHIEDIVIACGRPCQQEDPKTQWDLPTCADYEFDSALGESLKRGDRSASDVLQKRYETTLALCERQNIAGMLLGKVSDDTVYWTELSRFAEDAVRFTGSDDETKAKFKKYCDERELDVDAYAIAMYNALNVASKDARSHALLIRALELPDTGMIGTAISGLGAQHDLKSLELIDHVLARIGDESRYAAMSLVDFHCEEADRLAFKYLAEEDRADYTAAAAFFRATSRDE